MNMVELTLAATEFVEAGGRASVSAIQRHFKIGYPLAYEVIETMERSGIISEADHIGHRFVVPKENRKIFRDAYAESRKEPTND
jgi:DNA segregation ATPase FtsK/SpoIIIE-like protein